MLAEVYIEDGYRSTRFMRIIPALCKIYGNWKYINFAGGISYLKDHQIKRFCTEKLEEDLFDI